MAERETIQCDELLMPAETEVLQGDGIERTARAVVSEAVARFVGALGLSGSASHEVVDAFRNLPLGERREALLSALDMVEKVDQLAATISRRGAVALQAVAREDTPLETNEVPDVTEVPGAIATEAAIIVEEEQVVREQAVEELIIPEVTIEAHTDDQERPIELNDRSLRYIQSIFGDISSLDLLEKHKSAIAHTIDELRGVPRSRNFTSVTPQLLLMFAGLGDKEIGAHESIQKTRTAISVGISAAAKRIKDQPDYSSESARAQLLQNLGIGGVEQSAASKQVEEQEISEAVNEPEGEIAATPGRIELTDTPVVGSLRGEVRRILKKNGQNHLVDLGDERMSAVIEVLLDEDGVYKDHYIKYLRSGVRPIYDSGFTTLINSMAQKIATHVAASTHPHHRHVAAHSDTRPKTVASVSPLMMPQQRPRLMPVITEVAIEELEAAPNVETSSLLHAALEPATMSEVEWFSEARRAVTDLRDTSNWSEDEVSVLWNMVHFDKKHLYKRRTPATEDVCHKLLDLLEERGDDRFNTMPEIKASLTMLLNTSFGVKNLDDIQQSLKRKNTAVADGAAQRYVVAGIYELTREA
jgi:hypothetical protein